MKITAFDEKGNQKLKFHSINNLELRYTPEPFYSFGAKSYAKTKLEPVEIKVLIPSSRDFYAYHDLVTSGEVMRLKVDGTLSCNLTGYFERLDTEMNFDGTSEVRLSFRVIAATELYVMDIFEDAMINSNTTSDAIEAAIKQAGK